MKKKNAKKGFTLIELLVVIAIIAVLSVVVILTLNPAELLRQSRDSNRISDLSVTKSAIAFYLASVTSPVIGSSTKCYIGDAAATTSCGVFATTTTSVVSSTVRKIDGMGWLPINFNSITAGGSPLAQLPADPLFNPTQGQTTYFYAYAASSTGLVFKLDAHMESTKYGNGGSSDVVSTDGGYDNNSYEVGTNLLQL
jgi:prepilin-type N-terminal cleavage/methylation domain-containing protein